MKKTLSVFVSALAALTLAAAHASGFEKTRSYENNFTDIPADAWYASEVASAYELSLMEGIGGSLFDPDGSVTVAEAVTMASRASAIYADKQIPDASGAWYTPYIRYALSAGIIADGQFDDYDRPASRAEVASLFAHALPAKWFAEKNDVTSINDVSEKLSCHDDVLLLYKAGVLLGSDSYGNFRPADNITRAECAAVIGRVALPGSRLSRRLDKYSEDDAYLLAFNNGYADVKEGIASGWTLDNRGGPARTSVNGGYGTLTDISTSAGTAMIREFNDTDTGLLRLITRYTLTKNASEGAYAAFTNASGQSVWRVETKDAAWQYLNADGSYTKLCDFDGTYTFTFYVLLDIDNARTTIFINNTDCGTYVLSAPQDAPVDVQSFRFGTTDEGTAAFSSSFCEIVANYAVYNSFEYDAGSELFGWTTQNVTSRADMTLAENGMAARAFTPVSGVIVTETKFLMPKTDGGMTFDVKSGDKSVACFRADEKDFYVNDVKIYENYVGNLWYTLRLESDTDKQSSVIRLNGRKIAEIPTAFGATSVDNLLLANTGKGSVAFDHVRVFRKQIHDDYVPVPVVPKGQEKYNVGINVCSLWRNGSHYGWACITPFDDIEPVLGYYDEGSAETADWEIKYMVEHGIDYQAFCWFPVEMNGPIKTPNFSEHLYDGYMNAEYSDYMHYCLIWETSSAAMPNGMSNWKEHYVPYLIEYFFKDKRYMTIDNRPLLYIFGVDNLKAQPSGGKGGFGSAEAVKEAFNYLNGELAKIGLGDVIVIASHASSSPSLANMGVHATAAYNWGTAGYSLSANKNGNENNAKDRSVFTIPTISVGFNNVGWAQTRHPMMSATDFYEANLWAINVLDPATAKTGTWQENLYMISTWNEYGEGTFIMPTTDEKGFGYLDVLRACYTDEKADPSLNIVPTQAQKRRINRLYPQHKRLLRKEGNVAKNPVPEEDDILVAASFDLSSYDTSGLAGSASADVSQSSEGLSGTTSVNDPAIIFTRFGALNLDEIDYVRITARVPKDLTIETFFTTTASPVWEQAKGIRTVSVSDGMTVYYLDMTSVATWKGYLQNYRIDPGPSAGVSFAVKSVEFLKKKITPQNNKTILINEQSVEMNLQPRISENGEYLIAFDPSSPVALDYRLHAFHTWDKETGVLTIQTLEHTASYTVGSNIYTLDGTQKTLPYAVGTYDGLPLLPVKRFCEDVDYTFRMTAAGAEIETDEFAVFQAASARVPLQWEFDTPGDAEGWGSADMTLLVADGYLAASSVTRSVDPIISRTSAVPAFPAAKYKTLEYRVRYDYEANSKQELTLYFATASNPILSEDKTLKIPLKDKSSGGEWETYSFNLADQPLWNGTVTALRFDPFNAVGSIDVDYIRFIEDPDYEEPVPVPEKFEIKNGDAEEASCAFTSINGNIDIIIDPDDKGNHVYRVISKDGGKAWLYAEQSVTYTPGMTYQIDYDVRIFAVGTKTEELEEKDYSVLCNFRYTDAEGSADHIVGELKIKPSDGWKHYSAKYTVKDSSPERYADQFTIYSNPDGASPIGYCFDNVTVVPIED